MHMRRGNKAISATLELVVVFAASGCIGDGTDPLHAVRAAEASRALIGGFAANDPAYDAIGTILWLHPDASVADIRCTGALIGPHTVVTTKLCLGGLLMRIPDNRLVFAVGPDAFNPIAYYDIVDSEGAPRDDVGVYYIDDAPSGIQPIGLGSLGESNVGEEFAVAAFGVRDYELHSGLRRIGGQNLKALEGLTWEALLGSFEEFYKWYYGPECVVDDGDGGFTVVPPPNAELDSILCTPVEFARQVYESQRLETTDQFVAGGGEGDAQPCYGDLGGPLLRADADARLIAYGVISQVAVSTREKCGHGAVYAGFSEDVMEFLERTRDWVDPCGDETWNGSCTGSVARRCNNLAEGKRQIISLDCALAGTTCQIQPDGTAGCGAGDRAPGSPITDFKRVIFGTED